MLFEKCWLNFWLMRYTTCTGELSKAWADQTKGKTKWSAPGPWGLPKSAAKPVHGWMSTTRARHMTQWCHLPHKSGQRYSPLHGFLPESLLHRCLRQRFEPYNLFLTPKYAKHDRDWLDQKKLTGKVCFILAERRLTFCKDGSKRVQYQ